MLEEKNQQLRILQAVKISFKNEGEVETFSGRKIKVICSQQTYTETVTMEIIQKREKWFKKKGILEDEKDHSN